MRWLIKIVDRFCSVLGAIILMQMPLFMLQYQHQLRGHVAELQWNKARIQEGAARSGKNSEEYLQKFLKSSDSDIYEQGLLIQKQEWRLEKLARAQQKIQGASSFARPWIFLFYCESEILLSTYHFFTPGISFNYETLLYAVVGILLGHLLFQILSFLISRLYRKITNLLPN